MKHDEHETTTHHTGHKAQEPKGDESITQSVHWDKPNPPSNPIDHYAPWGPEEKKMQDVMDPEHWKKYKEDQRKHHEDALQKKQEIDNRKRDAELDRLNVKRFDEGEKKPDWMCVEHGCGEEKAPGQGFVCRAHSRFT